MSPLVNLSLNYVVCCQIRTENCTKRRLSYILDHLVHGHYVGPPGRGPTEQGGKVEEGGWKNVALLVVLQVGRVVALAQFLAIGIDKEGKMDE